MALCVSFVARAVHEFYELSHVQRDESLEAHASLASRHIPSLFITSGMRSIAMSVIAYLSVRLSARIPQRPHVQTSRNWLGPALMTVQYVMYFRFVDDIMFVHMRLANIACNRSDSTGGRTDGEV